MFSKNIFSQRLQELRIEKNINQKDLGSVVGLKISAISMMERGNRSPSVEVLFLLADYFGVSIDYLVGRTDNSEVNK